MKTIAEIRAQFPQYADIPDGDLLMGLHRKYYPDMHVREFVDSIDGARDAMAKSASWGETDLRDYWRGEVVKPMAGESQEQADVRAGGSMAKPTTGGGVGVGLRSALQGMTLGAGDEIVAGGAALARKIGGNDGPISDIYDIELSRERERLATGREERPGIALASEIGGAVALPIPGVGGGPTWARAAKGAGIGGLLGGAYGFLSGEGGTEERVENAGDVGLLSAGIGGALPLAGEAVRRTVRGVAGRGAQAEAVAAAPSVQTLKDQASRLYDAARQNGVIASQGQTTEIAGAIREIANEAGVRTPSGRVAESFPKLRDALAMVDDFTNGTMDPKQMQSVRRTLQAAAASADGSERRIGVQMLKTFDDWVEPMAPQFKVANELYRRAMGGEMIDTAIELAGSRAGQFTGSGFENALRTEFRALERQIIKGDLKGLSPDQVSAISRVARGGVIENAARDIGRVAPRGPVSFVGGGGVPFAVGTTFGGPLVGAAAGAGTLAAGEVGRRVATGMQTKNAALASALMRTGGQLPSLPAKYGSAATDSVVRGLIAADPTIASRMQGLLSQ